MADTDPDFPWNEPESTRFPIVVDGAVAGLIQFREQPEPRYRTPRSGGRQSRGHDSLLMEFVVPPR